MARRPDSGKTRQEFLESTSFPTLFRNAYGRWRAQLSSNDQRRGKSVMRDRLGLSDTKNLRNWMSGVSAPASEDAWASVRAILAEAPANLELLAALDVAFAAARGRDVTEQPPSGDVLGNGVTWQTGRALPAIFGLIEFRLRLGLNNAAEDSACPVHLVLIPGQAEREVDGRNLLVGFRYLLLRYDSPGHPPREDSFLGANDRQMPGVTRMSGGWRLEPADGETALRQDPTRGDFLFILEGRGSNVPATVVELIAESGGLDVVDPLRPARSQMDRRKKAAVVDAIFRERRDREGSGRYVLGRGEVWQENDG